MVEGGQKLFAECLSSRGGSYPAEIGSVDVGWLLAQHHLGSEVGGSKWLEVVRSGPRNVCPAVEDPIQRKSGVQMWADSLSGIIWDRRLVV